MASLKQATASALRQVAGHTTLDDILTTGRGKARDEVEQQIRHILGIYQPEALSDELAASETT